MGLVKSFLIWWSQQVFKLVISVKYSWVGFFFSDKFGPFWIFGSLRNIHFRQGANHLIFISRASENKQVHAVVKLPKRENEWRYRKIIFIFSFPKPVRLNSRRRKDNVIKDIALRTIGILTPTENDLQNPRYYVVRLHLNNQRRFISTPINIIDKQLYQLRIHLQYTCRYSTLKPMFETLTETFSGFL